MRFFLGLGLFAFAIGGCASSHAATPQGPPDGDAALQADADSLLPTCGPGPYVTLHIVVVGASTTPPPTRIEGAVFTSPSCPAMSLVSGVPIW